MPELSMKCIIYIFIGGHSVVQHNLRMLEEDKQGESRREWLSGVEGKIQMFIHFKRKQCLAEDVFSALVFGLLFPSIYTSLQKIWLDSFFSFCF